MSSKYETKEIRKLVPQKTLSRFLARRDTIIHNLRVIGHDDAEEKYERLVAQLREYVEHGYVTKITVKPVREPKPRAAKVTVSADAPGQALLFTDADTPNE